MSKLDQSDQLCLFHYVSETNGVFDVTSSSSSHENQTQAPSSIEVAIADKVTETRRERLERRGACDLETAAIEPQPDSSEKETSLDREPMKTALRVTVMQNLVSSSPVKNSTNEAVEDEAVEDEAVEDEAVEDEAVEVFISEHLSEEQERIFLLEQALDQALRDLNELNTRVKHQAILEEQVTLTEEYAYVQYQEIARLQEDLANNKEMIAQRNLTITGLESDRALAQTNLLSLQQDQLSLRQENAQWKNACQELQQECDRQHRKMMALEQENTAMQEQILQQARQSNEYETAVQYWKDRYTSLQQHLYAFQDVLAEKMNSPNLEAVNADISDFLAYIQSIEKEESVEPDVDKLSASNLNSFSIPDFLMRRYRHRGPGISK